MRRLAALALLLAPLSACAMPGPGYGPSPEYVDDYGYSDTPLHARLYSDASGLRVQVNRAAYVAIFEVVPGRGAALVYPEYQSERAFLDAGSSRVWFRAPRLSSLYYNADVASYSTREPHQYLLIASREPLRVQAIQNSPGELRRQIGYSSFTSLDSRALMNQIADLVLPPVADDEWDSDVLTVWPEPYTQLTYDNNERWITVRCPDGSIINTTAGWLQYACYERGRRGNGYYGEGGYGNGGYGNGNGRTPPPPRDTTGTRDTTGVQVPGRRRPDPRPDTTSSNGSGRIADRPGEGGARPRTFGDEPRVRPGGGDPGSVEPADAPAFRPREAPRLEPRRFTHEDDGSQPRLAAPGAQPTQGEPRAAPREEPRAAQPPREQPHRFEPRTETPRAEPRQVEPRAEPRQVEPRHETPREEPRRVEPRAEAPRESPRAQPREEPRHEQPRQEAPRQEPRSEPRSEPRHESPPPAQVRESSRAEPARSESASRPSVARPSAEPPRES